MPTGVGRGRGASAPGCLSTWEQQSLLDQSPFSPRLSKQKVNEGKLGAAHVISLQVQVDEWKGRKSRCKNWLQLCVKAHSVAGTPAVVVGQKIAFDREGDEKFIVAGRDLARALGYATPKEQ